jgi:hypothetical protein
MNPMKKGWKMESRIFGNWEKDMKTWNNKKRKNFLSYGSGQQMRLKKP